MENFDSFSLEIETYTEKLPEGEFYVVAIDIGPKKVIGKHREKPMSFALAYQNLAEEIKKKHYESKGVPYGTV